METEVIEADPAGIARAAQALARGRLVAFPTETVYGLGARADRGEALRAIFRAKGRPEGNPLIVHVASVALARELAAVWPDRAEALARAFWPGPLTLVVARHPARVAGEAAAFGPTVGLRVPAHPVALALLEACGLPIAAPSANRSSAISPTTAAHVRKSLGGRIDAVLDGGPTGYGIESTIVDLTVEPAALLRHGALACEALLAAGVPVVDRAARSAAPGEVLPAPGGFARHYAPEAELVLVPAGRVLVEVLARRGQGQRVGALELGRGSVEGGAGEGAAEVLPDDPAGYARGLYAALHRLDDARCEVIVVAEPPAAAAWLAIADRLRRASVRAG